MHLENGRDCFLDFSNITKVDLNPSSHEGYIHNFQVSTTKLVVQIKKNKHTKYQLKEHVRVLISSLKSMINSSTRPLNLVDNCFDLN